MEKGIEGLRKKATGFQKHILPRGHKSAEAAASPPSTSSKNASSSTEASSHDGSSTQSNTNLLHASVLEREGTDSSAALPLYKFRRGAQRNIVKYSKEEVPVGSRVFRALHETEYLGPILPLEETEQAEDTGKEGPAAPFYLGSDGQLYDKFYRRCDDAVTQTLKRTKKKSKKSEKGMATTKHGSGAGSSRRARRRDLSDDEEEQELDEEEDELEEDRREEEKEQEDNEKKTPKGKSQKEKGKGEEKTNEAEEEEDLFAAFPNAFDFASYFDYERALLQWKEDVERALSGLKLPAVMGRTYSRPVVITQLQELLAARSEQASEEDLQMKEVELKQKSSEGDMSESNEEDSFEGDIKEGEKNLRERVLENDPWDAVLVPPEPEPEEYDTFEEYEHALQRWARLCNATLPVIPPHATQLEQLIPIQSVATIHRARAADSIRRASEKNQASDAGEDNTIHHTARHTGEVYMPFFMSFSHTEGDEERTEEPKEDTEGERSRSDTLRNRGEDEEEEGEEGVTEAVRRKHKKKEQKHGPENYLTTIDNVHETITLLEDSSTISTRLVVQKRKKARARQKALKETLTKHLDTMLSSRLERMKDGGSYAVPLLPTIHGTLPALLKRNLNMHKEPYAPLRRTDLTPEMLKQCYDCEEVIGGESVQFVIPPFSLDALDHALLYHVLPPPTIDATLSTESPGRNRGTVRSGPSISNDNSGGGTGSKKRPSLSPPISPTGGGSFGSPPSSSPLSPSSRRPGAAKNNAPTTAIELIEQHKQKRESYISLRALEWREIQNEGRLDCYNSWYWPKVPEVLLQSHMEELRAVLEATNTGIKKFTLGQVEDILMVPMHADRFQECTSITVEHMINDSGLPLTLLQCVEDSISTNNFPELLELFELHSNNLLFHTKLSYLVQQFLQSGRGRNLMDDLVQGGTARHTRALSLVAYAMSFLESTTLDIFPFRLELYEAALEACAKCNAEVMKRVVHLIFAYYYIGIIGQTVIKNSFAYISLGSRYAVTSQMMVQKELATLLSENTTFLPNYLFKNIGHRCGKISSFFLFLTMQLLVMQCSQSLIETALKKPDTKLIDSIRELASSRFSHAQFGARRIFEHLLKHSKWHACINDAYLQVPRVAKTIMNDLSNPSHQERGPRVIKADLILSACLQTLTLVQNTIRNNHGQVPSGVVSNARAGFLLNKAKLYHDMLKHILSVNPQAPTRTADTYGTLLASLSKVYSLMRKISISKKIKKDKGNSKEETEEKLVIPLDDFNKLLEFVSAMSFSDALACTLRASLLSCLKQLVKAPDFPSWKEPTFLSKILALCKDGGDRDGNKMAWGLFYNTVRYHHGALDYLIHKSLFSQFVVSAASGNVVIENALHYYNKLFRMPGRESQRMAEGRACVRSGEKGLRSFEKDVKHLSKFFMERRLFIGIHMIYKRLLTDSQSACPGAPFTELVHFYMTLNENPSCEKLRRDIAKDVEYNTGLVRIVEMFGKESTLRQRSSETLYSPTIRPTAPSFTSPNGSNFSLNYSTGATTFRPSRDDVTLSSSPSSPFSSSPSSSSQDETSSSLTEQDRMELHGHYHHKTSDANGEATPQKEPKALRRRFSLNRKAGQIIAKEVASPKKQKDRKFTVM
ncbi:U3 small nucleolar ribonucleoprotein MPP10 [Balamuthia mandrillaris]